VVMALDREFAASPDSLKSIYVRSNKNVPVPLQDLYTVETRNTALSVAHSGLFPSSTISFNLAVGTSLGEVVPLIKNTCNEMGMPTSIRGDFQGTAQAFQVSLSNQPILIASAILAVYIVLGMLYESLIHPLTILSTLPSAGVGAILALILWRIELNVIGMIGILLLIGIVKKNAIMMIDYAIATQRANQLSTKQAIYEACMHRFRPIVMTTLAAIFGGLPLAIGSGEGSELRMPLGISIVGGLIVSQLVTLFTTPVVYMYLDQLANWWRRTDPSKELQYAPPATSGVMRV
jgi:multidrug efflux pump